MPKISFINLHLTGGLISPMSTGAHVPASSRIGCCMMVPCEYSWHFNEFVDIIIVKREEFLVNGDWIRWHRSAVEGTKRSCDFRSSLCGMFVYGYTSSNLTSRVPEGSGGGNLLSLLIKIIVS